MPWLAGSLCHASLLCPEPLGNIEFEVGHGGMYGRHPVALGSHPSKYVLSIVARYAAVSFHPHDLANLRELWM